MSDSEIEELAETTPEPISSESLPSDDELAAMLIPKSSLSPAARKIGSVPQDGEHGNSMDDQGVSGIEPMPSISGRQEAAVENHNREETAEDRQDKLLKQLSELPQEQQAAIQEELELRKKAEELRQDVTVDEKQINQQTRRRGRPHPSASRDKRTGLYLFPGVDGVPYRNSSGVPPHIKSKDPFYKKPQVVPDARVRVFDLSDEKQLGDYEQVMQSIARGSAILSREEMMYDDGSKNWRVLLRWVEQYLEDPRG